jgi:hypothetical protein
LFRSRLVGLFLIFCAAVAMTGCAGAVLGTLPNSASALDITPSVVQFGNVPLGTELSQAIRVQVRGKHSVTIQTVSVAGKFFTLSAPKLPATLSPGDSIMLAAAFRPGALGDKSGTISIAGNVPDSNLRIPVAGAGVKATVALTASPTHLAFGPVNQGTAKTQNVSLKSTGNADARISRISILGNDFKLSQRGDGVVLKPGQTLDVAVTFTPKQHGTANGMLNVASNAVPVSVPLGGIGAAAGSQRSVDLRWSASVSSDVVGYNVYRGRSANGVFTKVNAAVNAFTDYSDSAVSSGETYCYVVTAVNSKHVESGFSTPASVTVP